MTDSVESVAMFDMDGCLTNLHSYLPRKNVIDKLSKLVDDGYCIVVFSNQYGVKKGKITLADVKSRFDKFLEELPLSVANLTNIFFSTEKDYWRKPMTGMFDLFVNLREQPSHAFYVGDACGRKGDFSDSDLCFARNINVVYPTLSLPFYDEQFFDSAKPNPYALKLNDSSSRINVRKYIESSDSLDNITAQLFNINPDMIMMVGPQGSGKTTYAKAIADRLELEWINQDTLKTKKKVQAKVRSCIRNGQGFILDRTNTDTKSRAEWFRMLNSNAVSVCLYINVPKKVSFFMTSLRVQKNQGIGNVKSDVSWMAPVAIHTYFKHKLNIFIFYFQFLFFV